LALACAQVRLVFGVEKNLGMKHIRSTTARLCLAASTLLLQGCANQGAWDGIFTVDRTGGAKTCVAPTASPPDGASIVAQIQMNNDGGWCGLLLNRGRVAYDSYLMVTRPTHGEILAHHVGTNTRIDYTPDAGFAGTDSFAVRLIPGNAVIQGAVTVTR
jgi:hypothetical protein